MANERPYSSIVVDGVEQAPSRAMLYPTGFKPEDFSKPQIGIASTWSMVTPCNMHINELAEAAAMGADEAGAKSVLFNTITVSDGISMGTPGMRYSLVSREVIADSVGYSEDERITNAYRISRFCKLVQQQEPTHYAQALIPLGLSGID